MDFTSFEDLKNLLSQETGVKQANYSQSFAPAGLRRLGLQKNASQGPQIQRSIIGSTIKLKKQMPRKTVAGQFGKKAAGIEDGPRQADRRFGSSFFSQN